MNTLYFECYSGISGDMAAGALIDLGVDREFLLNQLHTVPLEQFEIDISKTDKQGISAVAFDIHTNHSTCKHSPEQAPPRQTPGRCFSMRICLDFIHREQTAVLHQNASALAAAENNSKNSSCSQL